MGTVKHQVQVVYSVTVPLQAHLFILDYPCVLFAFSTRTCLLMVVITDDAWPAQTS